MHKDNLLISCTYYAPNISGVSIYVQLLAESMTDHFQVCVLTSRFNGKNNEREMINKVSVIRSKVALTIGKGVVMPYFIIDAFKAVKASKVVNCHLPQLESVVVAGWAKILGKRLIITHHCEFDFEGPFSNKLIALLSFPFHLVSYLLADKIVAYTQDYADHSIFLKMFKHKLEIILPPILNGISSKKEILQLRNRLVHNDKEQKIIGYVGRIAWEKGLIYLVEAFEQIQKNIKAKLILVGPYEEVVGDTSSKKLIQAIKLNQNIILLGPIKHENLVNFYKICNCLVLPSTNNLETFGLVQAEAMVCGCPVVASDLPGVRVPVQLTGMGEIAKVGDSQDLAEKISKVLNGDYSKLSKKAKLIFDFEKFKAKYFGLFLDSGDIFY